MTSQHFNLNFGEVKSCGWLYFRYLIVDSRDEHTLAQCAYFHHTLHNQPLSHNMPNEYIL
jgi:hypothetical protein